MKASEIYRRAAKLIGMTDLEVTKLLLCIGGKPQGGSMKEPKYPLTTAQQKRMVFLLRKYMATVDQSRLRRHEWDLTKCDDETRKLFAQIGAI